MQDPIQRHPTRAEQLDILVTAVSETCPDGGSVLDLGCGTGYVGHLLAGQRPDLHFTGVDLSPDALQDAASNLATFAHAPALVPADHIASYLPNAGSSCDS